MNKAWVAIGILLAGTAFLLGGCNGKPAEDPHGSERRDDRMQAADSADGGVGKACRTTDRARSAQRGGAAPAGQRHQRATGRCERQYRTDGYVDRPAGDHKRHADRRNGKRRRIGRHVAKAVGAEEGRRAPAHKERDNHDTRRDSDLIYTPTDFVRLPSLGHAV